MQSVYSRIATVRALCTLSWSLAREARRRAADEYPAPVANIEVADRNLQFALLDEVCTERVGDYYWLSSLQQEYAAYQSSAGGPDWDDLHKRLGYDVLPELERFLLTLPLTADDLAKVTYLLLDGDREIYTLYPGWWH